MARSSRAAAQQESARSAGEPEAGRALSPPRLRMAAQAFARKADHDCHRDQAPPISDVSDTTRS
jgi:hypothetical protein